MPGNRYAQVLNTYATRRLLMAAIVGTVVMCLIPIVAWWAVGRTGPMNRMRSIFGLFLAFPAMFIGAHVKQQLASHEAELVPGYRRPHLVVGALTFVLPVLFAIVAAPAANGSIVGHASVLLFVFLASFQVMAEGSRLSGLFLGAAYLPILVPQLRIAGQQLLDGSLPGLAWSLLSAEAAIGILLFHRLANLTEDDPSYGNVMPMNTWDMRAAEVRRRNRAQLQKSPKVMLSLIAAESRRLDRLTATPATTRRQRVSLIQMSGDWPTSLVFISLMLFLMEGVPLVAPLVASKKLSIASASEFATALSWPLMLSLAIGWVLWLPQSQRWSRLGYESLRPSTREDWVQENGLAIIRNTLVMQMIWIFVQVVLLFTFLPAFATSPAIVNGLIYLAGAHLVIFGAGAWIASFGSMFWKLVGFACLVGLMQPSWLMISSYSLTYSWQIPFIAATCAVLGVVLTRSAYRRWCRIDLM